MIRKTIKIDGLCYKNMLDFGLSNLKKHHKKINQMNVFPVPDGDTGTNMLTTVKKGLLALGETLGDLSSSSKKFAKTVVFEARGNSGVILSQFLKGFSEVFYETDEADPSLFIKGLENGVKCAYKAVANPVEGTMLTVLREATEEVKSRFDGSQSINDIINLFVNRGKASLENTPSLLPTLKEAGVVDSGGAGVVYLFEGIKKYFDGEELEEPSIEGEGESVDYTKFNDESVFEYGYCMEFLLQPLKKKGEFSYKDFKKRLESFGSSIVTSFDEGKARVHIHTEYPEVVIGFCHESGEFLAFKMENMTVQHTGLENKILCSPKKEGVAFSVVAVAYDRESQKLLLEMGADAVIYSEESPSAKDYIDAFEKVACEEIIVFPNSSDSILTALQAKNLYKKAKVTVINSRSFAECYSSLPAMDFEEADIEAVTDFVSEIINNLYVVSVASRKNPVYDGEKRIEKKEYYAFSGKEIISVKPSLHDAVVQTVEFASQRLEKEIVTIFYSSSVNMEQIEEISSSIRKTGVDMEIFTVPVFGKTCDMVLSFE